MIHGSKNIRSDTQKFLSFCVIFCPFSPLTTWKIKILKLKKKTPGDIIILQICTINDNHMMYDSWDMEHDRQKFLSFWTLFCPFTPLTTQKIKILKNCTKYVEISSFYTCVPKITIIWYIYGSWDTEWDRHNLLSFWAISCPFTHLTAQESKFNKNEKISGDIIILHKCTKIYYIN